MPKKKKNVRQKRKNRHQVRAAHEDVLNDPSAANVQRYASARRKKGTKADVEGLER